MLGHDISLEKRHIDAMSHPIRRRRFLAAAGVLPLAAQAQPSQPSQPAQPLARELIVDRRTISVDNRPASVYRLGTTDGASGIALEPGERFRVRVRNRLDEPTIVHWHGQTPPADQDGVAGHGSAETLIGPQGQRDYDFIARPGTHWMHSHHGLQEQRLLAAPLIVREPGTTSQDAQEVVMLLQDFSWRDPKEILADLGGGGHTGHAGHGMTMSGGRMAGGMGLNDIIYDAFLANDRTLADPHVVQVERGVRVRLRVINAASATQFWLDLGALEATILATDGNPITPTNAPSATPIAIGQRLDFSFRMPWSGVFPIMAQVEGTTKRTGILLATPNAAVSGTFNQGGPQAMPPADLSTERRLAAQSPLATRPEDVRHKIALGGNMMRYQWTIDDRMWTDRRPLTVRLGQRVVLEMINNTPMSHPMHLHGHHFQVVEINGVRLNGPMRDTVLVPPRTKVAVAFDADNPGKWLLHCHNLYHMASGMMTELAYAGTS